MPTGQEKGLPPIAAAIISTDRYAAAEVDDVLSALDDALLHGIPFLTGQGIRTDKLREGLTGNGSGGSEDGHLFAVAAVGTGVLDFVSGNLEILGQLGTQTGGVEGGQSGNLRRFQTGVNQGYQAGNVGGVEDDNHVFYIGTVSLDVLAELLGDFGVAAEKILTGHTGLTGGASRGDDILGILEGLLDVGSESKVHTLESTVEHLFGDTFQTGSVSIVKADVGGKTHHGRSLGHVGTDHAGCADDDEFLISNEIHNFDYML